MSESTTTTPAELHAACLTALEEAKAVLAAGTSGPWRAEEGASSNWWIEQPSRADVADMYVGENAEADAALLTDAVNTRAAGLALAEYIFTRHAPDGLAELMLHVDSDEPCAECDEGDGHEVEVCAGCWPTWDGMDAHSVWPCATYRAAALSVGVVLP